MVRVDHLDMTFFHIAKCAGSTVEKWLQQNVNGEVYDNDLRHSSPAQLSRIFPEGFGWSFCVVRNPWDRMVSWYSFFNGTKKLGLTFEQYVDIIFFDERVRNTNMYNRPGQQVHTAKDVSYIVKFENLVKDFEVVQQRANCFEPLQHHNKSRENNKYAQYYTRQDHIDLIGSHYRDDIKQFGYTFGE